MLSVLIVDDHASVRSMARTALANQFVVVGEAADGEAALRLVGELFARGFHRLYAETDERNRAAHRLLERLGFRCEARFVEAEWFKGEWCTVRVYAVLSREWSGGPGTPPAPG
jgi:L-amino acid N-acyltransferase YncA